MLFRTIIVLFLLGSLEMTYAQEAGWHLQDADTKGAVGISLKNVYANLLKGKTSQTVVVAVIDSGVDIEHEDLKDVVWVNADEIPDNGIDDDKNGYVDDVNGWNFIGGADGNVNYDTYEVTRLYSKYRYKFENANRENLSKEDKKMYDKFVKWKEEVERESQKGKKNLTQVLNAKTMIGNGLDALVKALDGKAATLENIQAIDASGNQNLVVGKNIILDGLTRGEKVEDITEIKEMIFREMEPEINYYTGKANYAYNPDFDTRDIIGDNYADQNEKYYGNNDVDGPDSEHGTHVAGIIAATRNNDIGMDGVANNVKIMSIRTVPNGDERDKDVANAIRYAVDNGASIVNMSFGKGYSWNEKVVEDAIKYAEKNDVLLIHAAGNGSQDNDANDNYPNDEYQGKGFLFFKGKKKNYKNWIEVGALSYMNGEALPASFTNYGSNNVDVFAPGVQIYATTPDNSYEFLQGTSMAAPVVAGIAAILRSYYPSLTAVQVKSIIMGSVIPFSQDVILPGTKDTKVSFSKMSVSGGVVNAEKAVKLAKTVKGKKKISKKPIRA